MRYKQAGWEKNIKKTYNVKELAWTDEPPTIQITGFYGKKFWTPIFIFKFWRGRAASNQSD